MLFGITFSMGREEVSQSKGARINHRTGDYDGEVRQFIVHNKGTIKIEGHTMSAIYPRRAHNPVLCRVGTLAKSPPGSAMTRQNQT